MKAFLTLIFFATLVASCTAPTQLVPTNTSAPTSTPVPTDIPISTDTPVPTNVPPSTNTTVPTNLPTRTNTPTPTNAPAPIELEGLWQPQPPMLQARAAHAVVSTETAIYALAGTGRAGPVLEVERFDGQAWNLETTLPGHGLNAPAAAVLNNLIYLIGGFNTTTNVPTSDVLVYDLTTKTWSSVAPLPAPRGGHAATVFNGKIHVVGGGNSRSTIADHAVFDPQTNSWSEAAPLPRSEGSPALVVFADKLYAIGGRSGFSDFGNVYVYDPKSDTWSDGPAIEPRGTAGAVVYCDTIYVFGGESQAKHISLDNVYRLDVSNQRWVEISPMPHARNFARVVLFQKNVYVVGGSPMAGASHASEGSAIVESFHAEC